MSKKLNDEEVKSLKGQGYILQNDKEHFVCRVITVDGTLTPDKGKKIFEIADKYGEGHVSFTTRLTVEIPGIKYEDIDKVKEELKEVGLYAGGTGPRVRPVVSCKGTVCNFGLLDTQELNRRIHERFYLGWYNVTLPHKFKIGVGGCPNNCIKPNLNDLGIMGQRKPKVDKDLCAGCKKCGVESACRVKAANVVDGEIQIDFDKCNNCGLCIDKCHFDAVELDKEGVKVFIGGKWGKATRVGNDLNKIFTQDEALDIIEKAILYYRENGITTERFGDMVDRIGADEVQKALIGDEILDRKEEILSGDKHTKRGYSC
ncbi:MAG: (4Fe-4S)-binding protein [Clostridiaceae bacterium]|nr:(4Fe-4S)-binding protein [Clostridiaceae bacterium]